MVKRIQPSSLLEKQLELKEAMKVTDKSSVEYKPSFKHDSPFIPYFCNNSDMETVYLFNL